MTPYKLRIATRSCVSDLYFAHPEANYTQVGTINKDQMVRLTGRRAKTRKETERWIAANRR
ncbi:MAG: vitamin B12 dependent-methionine synthase activation domain-containing protein [Opitutaceae bacterium]